MKKFTFIAAAFLALSLGNNKAKAQTFSLEVDTNKVAWVPGGFDVNVHIKATNLTSSNIKLDWRMIYLKKDAGWTMDGGACDNITCKLESDPGLTDGTATFTTADIAPTDYCDFKLGFNGDAAATNTKSVANLEIKNGTTTDTATFIAYKGTYMTVNNILLKNNDIAIFPNPASSYVDVVYTPSADVKTIAIYNLIGKVVSVYKVTDKSSARCEFNSDMPAGIYVLRIADSKGNIVATRKITRQ